MPLKIYFIGCFSAGLLVLYKIYDLQKKMWHTQIHQTNIEYRVYRLSFLTINDVTCHCQFVSKLKILTLLVLYSKSGIFRFITTEKKSVHST